MVVVFFLVAAVIGINVLTSSAKTPQLKPIKVRSTYKRF